jgi:carbon monoxide dehydrogenase subunit G
MVRTVLRLYRRPRISVNATRPDEDAPVRVPDADEEVSSVEQRHAEATIARPADEVWSRIRDFGEVSWIPGVASCTVEGDVRTVTMQGVNFSISQRLLSADEARRRYTYCFDGDLDLQPLFGPGAVVREFEATLAVTPAGPQSSIVSYDLETSAEFFVDAVHAEYQGAVDSLKAELEG